MRNLAILLAQLCVSPTRLYVSFVMGINLTMNHYTLTYRGQESAEVEKLPDLLAPSRKQKGAATGTHGRSDK